MIQSTEHAPSPSFSAVNYCFLNPAWLPEWFWLPVAHSMAENGAGYFIPPLRRDEAGVNLEQNVDIIETTMGGRASQYIVALSRGVEYAVRYIDRMSKKGRLADILGWTVISSAGPSGYETRLAGTGKTLTRHTENYLNGIAVDDNGLETLKPETADTCLLHDVADSQLRDEIIANLIKARPLTTAEIESVPYLEPGSLPITWYIGRNDKVDSLAVSAGVARRFFDVEPTYVDWGHVGPLTHTGQVVDALLSDTEKAATLQEALYE